MGRLCGIPSMSEWRRVVWGEEEGAGRARGRQALAPAAGLGRACSEARVRVVCWAFWLALLSNFFCHCSMASSLKYNCKKKELLHETECYI